MNPKLLTRLLVFVLFLSLPVDFARPARALSLPAVQTGDVTNRTIYVDQSNTSGIEDGSPAHPFRTISNGLALAASGDTVLVAPGRYAEHVVLGSGETLRSSNGPAVTVIEPGTADTVVTCAEGARLDGFTVRGGLALNTAAVGCSDASPTIVNNWIVGIGGNGVRLWGSRNGEIAHNRIWGDPSFDNGGCPCNAVVANGGVRIHHNEIYAADTNGNAKVIEIADSYDSSWPPFRIASNLLVGTLWIFDSVSHAGGQNLVANNVLLGGINGASGNTGPVLIANNTIIGNVYLQSNTRARLINNIITSGLSAPSQYLIEVSHNNFGGPSYPAYVGISGNISKPPAFVNPVSSDYHLTACDPGIDQGAPVPELANDFDGDPRSLDGNGDGQAVPDMGADERVYDARSDCHRLWFPVVGRGSGADLPAPAPNMSVKLKQREAWPGWNNQLGGTGLYVADVDGDGANEIVGGSYSGQDSSSAAYYYRNHFLQALRFNSVGYRSVWTSDYHSAGSEIRRSELLDFDSNGVQEIYQFLRDGSVDISDPNSATTRRIEPAPAEFHWHFRCLQVPVAIPDNDPAGATCSVSVPDTLTIQDISVDITLHHTYIGELSLMLVSPTGTWVPLHNRSGGSADDIVGNYPATLTPAQSLESFFGENTSGTWILQMRDYGAGDLGRLDSLQLNFSTTARLRPNTVSSAQGDLDGDGATEFALLNEAGVLTVAEANTLDIKWQRRVPAAALERLMVTAGDVTGDGRAEVASSTGQIFDGVTGDLIWDKGSPFGVALVVTDVTGDNRSEILAGDSSGWLNAYELSNPAPLWRVNTQSGFTGFQLADVNRDGRLDIVIGDGPIQAYDTHTLSRMWTISNPSYDGVANLAVGDTDGDGALELVFGDRLGSGRGAHFYVYDIESQQLEWRSDTRMGPMSLATLDINGDNVPERFVGAQTVLSSRGEGKVMAVDGASGQVIWEQDGLDSVLGLSLVDANGDGRPELWAHTEHRLQVFDPEIGAVLWRSYVLGADSIRQPNFTQLDADPALEILVTSDVSAVVFDGAQYQEQWRSADVSGGIRDSSVADLDGDGQKELALATQRQILVLDPKTMDVRWWGDLPYNILTLSAGDVDGDGNAELVAGSWSGQLLVLDGKSLIVERGVQLAPLVLSPIDAVTQILAINRTDGSLPSIYALAGDDLRLLDGRDLSLMGHKSVGNGSLMGPSLRPSPPVQSQPAELSMNTAAAAYRFELLPLTQR